MSETPVPDLPDLPDTCWPVDWSCVDNADSMDPTVKARAEALATQTLRTLTGGKVGGCAITVRPCAWRPAGPGYQDAPVAASGDWMVPMQRSNGSWTNVLCGRHRSSCGCTSAAEIILPSMAGQVESVEIDGALLDQSAYRVDNGNLLVRTDGGAWPMSQDMTASSGPGTFMVTYRPGAAPDGLAAYAAGLLANEFAKACSGKTCRLPAGVSSVTRQGVSYEVVTGMFPGGVTGIREIDAWIRTWNPYAVKTFAQVRSIDGPRSRVTTWRP